MGRVQLGQTTEKKWINCFIPIRFKFAFFIRKFYRNSAKLDNNNWTNDFAKSVEKVETPPWHILKILNFYHFFMRLRQNISTRETNLWIKTNEAEICMQPALKWVKLRNERPGVTHILWSDVQRHLSGNSSFYTMYFSFFNVFSFNSMVFFQGKLILI